MPRTPILGAWSHSRGQMLSDAESWNLILELIETKDGLSPGALYNWPGLDLLGTLGDGPIRGARDLKDILYVVSGPSVYSLTPNGIGTYLGDIGSRSTNVSMFANATQMMIVDGVGAWLVPGGYPLTGGTPGTAGGLYAVGDQIQLQGNLGSESAYPWVTVTSISNNPAQTVSPVNPGSGYSNATNVATTAINGQPGIGTGLTLNIVASNGIITSAAVNSGGSGYNVGDTGTIGPVGGVGGGAVYLVTGVPAGSVTSVILLWGGGGYLSGTGVATVAARGVPLNIGVGLTVNTTTSGGAVTGLSIASGGHGYAAENVGYISGGDGTATYAVTSIGPNGAVTGIKVTTPGAMNPIPASFTQRSTTGSGSNFTLSSPTFGSFIGIVPIEVPFDRPLMGDTTDGFGLLVFESSQNIAASAENDLSTWPGDAYGVANQSGDVCTGIKVLHNEVYVFKQRNTEVWVDEGLSPFPLQPLTGVHMQFGCGARTSIAAVGDRLIWVGQNANGFRQVVIAAGYQVTPVATQAVTYALDQLSNIGDAIGYSFEQGGHSYYVLILPEADETWVHDVTTSALAGAPMWSRIAAWDGTTGTWQRHWSNCYWPWRGVVAEVNSPSSYQPYGVTIASGVNVANGGLTGLPGSFATGLFSMWVSIPDSAARSLSWTLQASGGANAITISVQNDSSGTPEIQIELWDTGGNAIVTASYTFTNWSAWVNLLVSFDTTTQTLQVYANTGGAESLLTATSITWASTNPVKGGVLEATLA